MKRPPPLRPGVPPWLLACAGYAVLSLVVGSPVWGRWETHYLGAGEIEGWLWRYWWMKEFIAPVWEQRPFRPGSVLYVLAVAGSYPEFGNVLDLQLLLWPMERLFGLPLGHTLRTLLVLFLNGAAGYALGRYLWGHSAAAWLLGAGFGYNPYFLYEVANGRVRQAVGFTLPLLLLYLLRAYRERRPANAVLLGFWWGMTGAFYLYYGMFATFFVVLAATWWLLRGRRHDPPAPQAPIRFATAAVVALLVVLPFVSSYLEQLAQGRALPETVYLADFPPLPVLLTPQPVARPREMLPNSIRRFATDTPPADYLWRADYARGAPLALTAAALIPLLFTRPFPGLMTAGLLLFYGISLGPYLRWGGPEERFLAYPGEGIALPYVWLYKYVPGFSRLFSPIRAEAMVYLFLAVLAGRNLHHLTRGKRKGPWWAALAAVGLVAAGAVQMAVTGAAPLPATRPQVAPVYRLLAAAPPVGLIELPLRTGDYLEYNQTVHGQKVFWSWAEGEMPRGYPSVRMRRLARPDAELHDNAFIRYLEALTRNPGSSPSFRRADIEEVRRYGYRLVLLHERGCYHIDPVDGHLLFEGMAARLISTLGEPALKTTEPAPEGLPGRRRGETAPVAHYRLWIFSLDPEGELLPRRASP